MSSLKGIMLSRHQFPPTPTRGGVANGGGIPIWQRTLDSTTPTKTAEEEPTLNGDLASQRALDSATPCKTAEEEPNLNGDLASQRALDSATPSKTAEEEPNLNGDLAKPTIM